MKAKKWLLIVGMAVLIGGGAVTAQASPLQEFSDQLPKIHSEQRPQQHMLNFKQTPAERSKMLSLLHIDEKQFNREIRHGKSIAEIAADRNVSKRAVIKLLKHQIKDHIDLAKREHRISPAQASDMKKHATEHATELVNEHHRWFR
jgi:hypothetical protein